MWVPEGLSGMFCTSLLCVHQVCRVLKAKILLLLQEALWFSSRLPGRQQGRGILSMAAAAAAPCPGPACKLMKGFSKPEDNVEVGCLALVSHSKITLYNPRIHLIQESKTHHLFRREVITPLLLCTISKLVP